MQSEMFHKLSNYTLSHPDRSFFIHQYIVDAQTAQTADKNTKPIAIVYSLIGLYLAVEKNYTGRQVQLAHMQLSKNKMDLPHVKAPCEKGKIIIADVLNATPGIERDNMIRQWCTSVWYVYKDVRETIVNYCDKYLII